jgi:hypothetical protein
VAKSYAVADVCDTGIGVATDQMPRTPFLNSARRDDSLGSTAYPIRWYSPSIFTAQSDLTVQTDHSSQSIRYLRIDLVVVAFTDGITGPSFWTLALLKTRALSSTIKHCFTTLNSLKSADRATLSIRFVECLPRKRATLCTRQKDISKR